MRGRSHKGGCSEGGHIKEDVVRGRSHKGGCSEREVT